MTQDRDTDPRDRSHRRRSRASRILAVSRVLPHLRSSPCTPAEHRITSGYSKTVGVGLGSAVISPPMLRSEEPFAQARGREPAPRRWLPFCAAPASTALLTSPTLCYSISGSHNRRGRRAMSPRRGALATSASTSHVSCQYGSLSSTALASRLYGGPTMRLHILRLLA